MEWGSARFRYRNKEQIKVDDPERSHKDGAVNDNTQIVANQTSQIVANPSTALRRAPGNKAHSKNKKGKPKFNKLPHGSPIWLLANNKLHLTKGDGSRVATINYATKPGNPKDNPKTVAHEPLYVTKEDGTRISMWGATS